MEYKPRVLEIKLLIQTYSIQKKLIGRAKMPNNALFKQYLSDELKSNHLRLVLYFHPYILHTALRKRQEKNNKGYKRKCSDLIKGGNNSSGFFFPVDVQNQ